MKRNGLGVNTKKAKNPSYAKQGHQNQSSFDTRSGARKKSNKETTAWVKDIESKRSRLYFGALQLEKWSPAFAQSTMNLSAPNVKTVTLHKDSDHVLFLSALFVDLSMRIMYKKVIKKQIKNLIARNKNDIVVLEKLVRNCTQT